MRGITSYKNNLSVSSVTFPSVVIYFPISISFSGLSEIHEISYSLSSSVGYAGSTFSSD